MFIATVKVNCNLLQFVLKYISKIKTQPVQEDYTMKKYVSNVPADGRGLSSDNDQSLYYR